MALTAIRPDGNKLKRKDFLRKKDEILKDRFTLESSLIVKEQKHF